MIRSLKYVSREESKTFVEKFPPHSCLIWVGECGDNEMFKEDSDKVLYANLNGDVNFEKIVEFVLLNNNKVRSNTTLYCEDYTLSVFFDETLALLPGRMHLGSGPRIRDDHLYAKIKEYYAGYVLGGIL